MARLLTNSLTRISHKGPRREHLSRHEWFPAVIDSVYLFSSIAATFDPSILGDAGAYLDDCVPHDDRLPENAKSYVRCHPYQSFLNG